MLSQSSYRNLFFNSLATMIDLQRAFVCGSMLAPVSSKSKTLIQAQTEISPEASVKQEVESARAASTTGEDQNRAQVQPTRRRAGRVGAAAVRVSHGRAVVQNRGKRKNHLIQGPDKKRPRRKN
jgi:hypothetical protein